MLPCTGTHSTHNINSKQYGYGISATTEELYVFTSGVPKLAWLCTKRKTEQRRKTDNNNNKKTNSKALKRPYIHTAHPTEYQHYKTQAALTPTHSCIETNAARYHIRDDQLVVRKAQ